MAFADILIIGSGFGGAVMAARLGAAANAGGKKRRVLVLEKGNDHTARFDVASGGGPLNAQGNRFRQNLALENTAAVVQIYTDRRGSYRSGKPSLNVIAGKGIGGGSNVYDGVRIPAALGHSFRRHLGTDSGLTWALIPEHLGADSDDLGTHSGALGHSPRST